MQASETESIQIDRTDGIQKTLSGYGGRVATLLGLKKVKASPHMVAAPDDFLRFTAGLFMGSPVAIPLSAGDNIVHLLLSGPALGIIVRDLFRSPQSSATPTRR